MTGQYEELIDFLGNRFGRVDERFDGVDVRLTKVEVNLEALRDDVRILANGLSMTKERLDRHHRDTESRVRALETHRFEG